MKNPFFLLLFLASLFTYGQETNDQQTTTSSPSDMKIVMGVFPGCEDVAVEERKTCFSKNFREWLAGELPEKVVRQSAGIRATVILTFGRDGKLAEYKVKSKSKKLEKELYKIVANCPAMTPVEVNGEKVTYYHSFPLNF